LRELSAIDKFLQNCTDVLGSVVASDAPHSGTAKDAESAALMRVNHSGEVAAQALYKGQSVFSRNAATRSQLLAAAAEEQAHLDWCEQRLSELGGEVSKFGPFWYWGSYSIGMIAGLAGDHWSLGFVKETEDQVVEHLQSHLQMLPNDDDRSRQIVTDMIADESRHATEAAHAGAAELPAPVKAMMRATAKIMTTVSYKI